MTNRPVGRLLILLALLLALSVGSVLLGAVPLGVRRSLRALFSPDEGDPAGVLLREIRLPRVLLASLVGSSLSLSGALLQAFFQNPMAGPYVVGVSAGAGCAAVAVTLLGLTFHLGPFDTKAMAAFVGGVAAVALVYGIARRIHYLRAEGLLLVGIAVGGVLSAFTSLMLVMHPAGAPAAIFWLLGSFSSAKWESVSMVGLVLIAAGGASLAMSRDLNLLLWGDDVAQSLGSPVRRIHAWVLILSSLLASASVAVCGVIGFIGLMVPHLARGFLRTSDHRFVLPGSALIGALLVVAADVVARTAIRPVELPVGAITSAFGAPFLVFLVARRHRSSF